MADNKNLRDATATTFAASADELVDASFSPKVSVLPGDGSVTPISPSTSGGQATSNTSIGATNESAAASDTATSGLNGLSKRLLQRITTLLAALPAALTGSGNLKVAVVESTASVAITAAALPLMAGAATQATAAAIETNVGATSETVAASDTATAGLNALKKRSLQRLTTLLAALPAALTALGNLKVSIQENATVVATYSAQAAEVAVTSDGVVLEIKGSATKTVKVTRIAISGTLTTATVANLYLGRYSTAVAGGTLGSASSAKHDTNNAAATAAVKIWSTPGATGTLVGYVRSMKNLFGTAAIPPHRTQFLFGHERNAQPLVLRGTSEFISLFLACTSYAGASISFDIEWTEE